MQGEDPGGPRPHGAGLRGAVQLGPLACTPTSVLPRSSANEPHPSPNQPAETLKPWGQSRALPFPVELASPELTALLASLGPRLALRGLREGW